jgi:D-alanyl-D-alanine dipeptidase
MGGEIDAIGPVSEPDHHARAAAGDPSSEAALWHRRRTLLHEALGQAGMVRHPHEWWHFSHGDQLWAWTSGRPEAIYGRVPD